MMTPARVASLRAKSKYYPELHFESEPHFSEDVMPNTRTDFFISTLVRVLRDGKWYVVHVAECSFVTTMTFHSERTIQYTINRLIHQVCMVQLFYKLQENDKPEWNQQSEEDRLNPLNHL